MEKRVISTQVQDEDIKIEKNLRPQTLDDYIGQQKAKKNLKVYIEAAKQRGESLDHVLFFGPPGLGKTTLAGIIANEMGTHMKITSGPAIGKPGEMAAILSNLQEGDILFVDEIHRLNRQVEEVLYPAMEDYVIDIMIGKGATARSIRLELPKFTLVGATTRAGLLSAPLRDRFGVIHHLEFYTVDELKTIIIHSAEKLGVEIDEDGAYELARRSRGTPRLANRLLKRVRDFAEVKYDGKITKDVASFALDLLEVDKFGLDQNDRNILMTIIEKFQGGPVGLDTLAASIGEDSGTIEDVYEPYLVQNGFVIRKEEMVLEDGKFYTVMDVRREKDADSEGKTVDPDVLSLSEDSRMLYGDYLIQTKNPVLLTYLKEEETKLLRFIEDLSAKAGDSERAAERLSELKLQLKENQEVQHEMQGDH